MKVINAKMHGYLDYFVVLVFLATPSLLHFERMPAVISYLLAGVHLALTLLTDFSLGAARVIPLKVHGVIELIVGPCLIALPFVLGFTAMAVPFYAGAGVVILLVWTLTDYGR